MLCSTISTAVPVSAAAAEAAGEVGLFGLGRPGGGFVEQHHQGLAGEGTGEFDRAAGAGGQSAATGMHEVVESRSG